MKFFFSFESFDFFILFSEIFLLIMEESSLEPKSLRMIILIIILVKVLCCLYQSSKHYIEIWHERPFSLQALLLAWPGERAVGRAWAAVPPIGPIGPAFSGRAWTCPWAEIEA